MKRTLMHINESTLHNVFSMQHSAVGRHPLGSALPFLFQNEIIYICMPTYRQSQLNHHASFSHPYLCTPYCPPTNPSSPILRLCTNGLPLFHPSYPCHPNTSGCLKTYGTGCACDAKRGPRYLSSSSSFSTLPPPSSCARGSFWKYYSDICMNRGSRAPVWYPAPLLPPTLPRFTTSANPTPASPPHGSHYCRLHTGLIVHVWSSRSFEYPAITQGYLAHENGRYVGRNKGWNFGGAFVITDCFCMEIDITLKSLFFFVCLVFWTLLWSYTGTFCFFLYFNMAFCAHLLAYFIGYTRKWWGL